MKEKLEAQIIVVEGILEDLKDKLKIENIPVWTTREGEKIRYPDLKTGHLKNIIRYILRRSLTLAYISSMLGGEMALLSAEQEMDGSFELLDGLLEEVDRRGMSRAEMMVGE